MKHAKATFGALILGLVLSSAALAGDVSTPGYVSPPPPPVVSASCQETETALAGSTTLPDLATELLTAVLTAIYQ